ncbi:MAG: FGGY family carbohydrate kinase, partial [Thermoflexales bacterium]
MRDVLLGIDVGSSGCKVTALDADGHVVGGGSAPLATSYPRPGWAVQDPHDWHAAACAAVRECLSQGSLGPG